MSILLCHALVKIQNDRDLPLILPFPQDGTRTLGDMVAFAACILEFPVAYVPSGDGSDPFLAGIPLDVYECVLVQPVLGLPKHTMLKFSCPQTITAEVSQLRPDVLGERLRARFAERLERAGFRGTLLLRHTVETMDRVAL
ncbi:hypothetical protein BD310DRAFT_918985 [Dichomitus squalens]|uniref:Uncharacterized protein n=1 Tax=Dichomitus squalens TaxID=114155 RepID=A0A4Q9Q4G5_9APHY|nr:hypothetical protein BD310DRAFT_918985 [Dichomitus squalens]